MSHDPRRARCYDDPNWKFSRHTDLAATFKRIIKAQKEAAKAEPVKPVNVCPIKKAKP
jgi:hypothetical protein